MRAIGLAFVLVALTACGDDYRDFDASVAHDAGVDDEGVPSEGGVPVRAIFTVVGCDKLDFDSEARPRCVAPRQRPLTFVPLGVGVSTVVWTFSSGTPASSTLISPESSWSQLGSYTVSLAAAGGGGTALGSGTVQIIAGSAGAACAVDADCDGSVGLTCLCGSGAGCPAELGAGLCARRCETVSCAPGEACVDLTRSGSAPSDGGVGDGGASDPFRVRLCLPTCSTSSTCRSGLSCLELPSVPVAAPLGADYAWVKACFAPVLGEVGAACAAPDGTLDGSRCTTGKCEALGARGVCTDICDVSAPCPASAACVTMPSVGARCLRRCTAGEDCGDPLMACEGPGSGGLGFALSPIEPVTTMLCAAKRCTQLSDCAPAGTCKTVGAGQFCER